jgi:hypothetical protein
MRRILIALAILAFGIIAISAIWIFAGRELSLFLDRFWTREISSTSVHSIAYEGAGTAGTLIINDLRLSLNHIKIPLNIGSTKDNQFALASSGKVFALGALASTAENGGDYLAAMPQAGDEAVLLTRHSALSWPTPFDFNFMTGHSPSWKRHMYYELRWKKPSGAILDMLWRYEQPFYGQQLVPGDGWGSGFGVHEGSTGLVRVEIRP